jgi:hypothetical protein
MDPAGRPRAGSAQHDPQRGEPDAVICFAFVDRSVEELDRNFAEPGYQDQLDAIAPRVQSIGTEGLDEIVENGEFAGEAPA